MRDTNAPEDSAHSGADPSTFNSDLAKLRIRIGMIADCLTRMLDAAAGDVLAYPSWKYLVDQNDYILARVHDMGEVLDALYQDVQAGDHQAELPEPAELVELTLPTRDAAAGERGTP